MSEHTENLALPYIMPSQAQKHVTHNEAIRMLDAVVQLSVESDASTAPPANPSAGSRYIIGANATSAWAGKQDQIAIWQDGAWAYFTPLTGWLAYVVSRDALSVFDGQSWAQLSSGNSQDKASFFGINTDADTTNRLAAKTDSILFSHDDVTPGTGDVRLNVNKAADDKTASLLFQSKWSGRAEMGLSGNDNFALKVSDNGTDWTTAMTVDAATGKPAFPALNLLEGFALNMYSDAGRFDAGDGSSVTTTGAFKWPDYLLLYGGATAASAGKFIHNNATYGGTAPALAPTVNDLITKIRHSSSRRYGVEFHVAELTSGTGNLYPISFAGQSLPLAMICKQRPQPPAYTFHIYIRAVDGTVGISTANGQTITRDGVSLGLQEPTHLVPADGWVSLVMHSQANPYFSSGYQPYPMAVYSAAGTKWQIACPALMGGLTKVDPNIGAVAPMLGW